MAFFLQNLSRNMLIQSNRPPSKNVSEMEQALLAFTKFTEVGTSPIDQLKITPNNNEDITEINEILWTLEYPSSEIAKLHRNCYRLGNEDLVDDSGELNRDDFEQLSEEIRICPCCGFIEQRNTVKLCTNLRHIKNFGVSAYLYFQMIKSLILMILTLFVVYGIYSLTTNIIAATKYTVSPNSAEALISNEGILILSLGSKQLNADFPQNKDFYYIQCWIGLLVVLIWGVIIFMIKVKQYQVKQFVNRNYKSASDYSIAIYNIPHNLTQETLQQQLDEYFQQHRSQGFSDESTQGLKIATFNKAKPFYLYAEEFDDKQLKKINEEYEQLRHILVEWIHERCNKKNSQFSATKQQRQKKIRQFNLVREEKQRIEREIADTIIDNFTKDKNEIGTTTAFVTFENSKSKQFILSQEIEGFGQKIGYYLTCCFGRTRFHISDQNGNISTQAYIQPAPEPEDIRWPNLGHSRTQIIRRKFFTFLIAFLLLCVSFAVAYGLSTYQIANRDNLYISFIISLLISIFNLLIVGNYLFYAVAIQFMTKFQKDPTTTNHQTSLAIKSVLALMINNIFTPIMVNYFLKEKNLYGLNGLAYDVFFLGLTNSFLGVLVVLVDPLFILSRIVGWWQKKPKNKLKLSQIELNRFNENIEFETGHEYVYMINLFLFTCFFSSLQPIITVFAMTGLLMMYWAQKFRIFHHCCRPIPGSTMLNASMVEMVSFGTILFSLGNLTWSNFFPDGQPKYALVPNLISCGVGLIIFLFPFKKLVERAKRSGPQKNEVYRQNRIYLTAEYDRLNPFTAEKAIKQYQKFFQDFRANMKNISQEENKKILEILCQQFGHHNRTDVPGFLLSDRGRSALGTQILNTANYQGKTLYNPFMIYHALFPDDPRKLSQLRVPAQNWVTDAERKEQKYNPNSKQSPANLLTVSYMYNQPPPNIAPPPPNNPNFLNPHGNNYQNMNKYNNRNMNNPFNHLANHMGRSRLNFGYFGHHSPQQNRNHFSYGSNHNLNNFSIE